MNSKICRIFALAALLLATLAWAQDDKDNSESKVAPESKNTSDEIKRVEAATSVLNEIMAAPDRGVPNEIMESAKCVAVVPSMLKAGFIVGGRYGRGIATCRTARGWSAPAPFTIAGGDWGLQIGGEAIDLVMLIMNEKGMRNLLNSKFKIGVDASASAGPVGRTAAADTDWKLKSEVLTYSRSRGVFAGITLNGAVVKQDNDETRVLYGKMIPFSEILTGKAAVPPGTEDFVATVRKYTGEARERGEMSPPPPARPAPSSDQPRQ
jgi:SH3 domain-containing YSC84-like protein 1